MHLCINMQMQSCRELLGNELHHYEVFADQLDRRTDRREGSVGVILAGALVGKVQIIQVRHAVGILPTQCRCA